MDRRIASIQRQGVDAMVALPEVLILRQGTAVYGLDPYSLQQLWIFRGKELVGGPILLGERLFLIDKVDDVELTSHRVVELDAATGYVRWQKETMSSTARVLSACGKTVFLFESSFFSVSGNALPTRVSFGRHLGPDLARAVSPQRIWLAGDHLVVWVPELRLAATLALDRKAQPWRRPFAEDLVNVEGCGDMQVATLSGGALLGLNARTGKTVWQLARPEEEQAVFLLQPGVFLSIPAGRRLNWLDPHAGTVTPFVLEDSLESPGGLLQDKHERPILFAGSRLTVYSSLSKSREWTYDAGEPIRLMSPADGYIALVTESGRLDVLGQSHPHSTIEEPLPEAGGVELTVDPEDAFVWMDGFYVGPGGRRILNLRPGQHHLRLVHQDRKRLETKLEVVAGKVSTLTLVMSSRSQGSVRIDASTTGASVIIDGERVGKTPLPPRYGYPEGQVLDVTVTQTGYRDVRQQLTVREDGAELSANLEFAPLLWGIYALGGHTGSDPIRGWREGDIGNSRVVGEPYRPADGDALFGGTFFFELGPPRWRVFSRFSGIFGQESSGVETGLWLSIDRRLRIELGASYLKLDRVASSPPGDEYTVDENAPLEEWSHPIPHVLVRNEAPSYWLGKLRLRPRAGLLLELGAGRLEGARLRGTALVEDASGHLVRDPERFYDFRAYSGEILEARLQLALGTFRLWKLAPSTAVEIHYRHRNTDFRVAEESTGELTLGIGILYFRSRPEDL